MARLTFSDTTWPFPFPSHLSPVIDATIERRRGGGEGGRYGYRYLKRLSIAYHTAASYKREKLCNLPFD